MIDKKAKEEIKKIAIKNALDYGKAREGTVINGALSKFPELKSEIRELSLAVKAEVERVNKLKKEDLEEEASGYLKEFEAKEKEKAEKSAKPKMVLEGATKGNFLTRFAPAPNGYMQVGNGKAAFLEREFADIYSGKVALYFDDTNPEMDKQEFVDAFKKDLKWLGIDFDMEYYASDNIEALYGYASKLIDAGKVYVCMCEVEKIKEDRAAGRDCPHRSQKPKKNSELWKEMLDGKLKNAILRFKGDMKSLNTVMRDPTFFRIKDEPHYRQGIKYRVWPTYDFNTPIMDSIKGVTDAMRSKEYELRDELYHTLLKALDLRDPRIHSFSRLDIENNLTSKRKIKELMKQKVLWGWDDPRLVTIAGLRRRGVSPKAIKEFVLRFGLSKSDAKVNIEMLLAENRKIIDSTSKRLFFVDKPLKLAVKGIPKNKIEIKIRAHPNEDLGYREYKLNGAFFINAYDADNLRTGDQIRLKDAFDIIIENAKGNTLEASYTAKEKKEAKKVQWVGQESYVRCKALMVGDLLRDDSFSKESLKVVEGYAEAYVNELDEGDHVQFERFGFFKFDKRKEMSFISL